MACVRAAERWTVRRAVDKTRAAYGLDFLFLLVHLLLMLGTELVQLLRGELHVEDLLCKTTGHTALSTQARFTQHTNERRGTPSIGTLCCPPITAACTKDLRQ